MVKGKHIRLSSMGVYVTLLVLCTIVIVGMLVNVHNRDCSEQVILKTYALIKSMSNGNVYEQQKLLTQLIQEDKIIFQRNSGIFRESPPQLDQTFYNEKSAGHALLPKQDESSQLGDGHELLLKQEEPSQLDDGLHQLLVPQRKKIRLADGSRGFAVPEREEEDYKREVKTIPPMWKVKASLRKELEKHINTEELSRIRNRLIESGLTFERTVTTKVEDENEEQAEKRRNRFNNKIQAPFQSCAVVGNSGVLDQSYCGAEIDAHDFVMRSNMAPIRGFEEDVGTKVNFMTLNGEGTKILLKCLKSFNNSCQRVYESIETIDKSILWFSKYGTLNLKFVNLIGRHLNSTVTHPSAPLSEDLMKFWEITEHPSSGLFLYSIAAPLCKTISLYGFYPYSKLPDGKSTRYHYYEKFFIEDFDMGHDLPKEFKLLMKLNSAGALRLKAKPCL